MCVRKLVAPLVLALATMILGFVGVVGTASAAGDPAVAEARLGAARGDLEAGLAAMRGRDWALARVYLQRAVDRDPQDPDALAAMGETLLRLGDTDGAFLYAEAAVTVEPENRRAIATLGELALVAGNVAEARRRADQLAKLCPQGCAERSRLEAAIAGQVAGQGGS